VLLQDQLDGWFPLAPPAGIHATIVRAIESAATTTAFYVVQFDPPLEVQESPADTPSGIGRVLYEHAIIRSRWQGVSIGSEFQVSVFVLLPPSGRPLPLCESECAVLPVRAWASCTIRA
jgi:hypothetical protein